jgi:TPR repeat protein
MHSMKTVVLAVVLGMVGAGTLLCAAPIHDAAKVNDTSTLAALLKAQPSLINAPDADGWTPLHWAASEARMDAVELLLANGAEVNIQEKRAADRCLKPFSPLNLARIAPHQEKQPAMSNRTPIPVRTTLIPALFCTAGLFLSYAQAQQSEADRQALAQLHAKAELGDAQSQFELGLAFYGGKYGVAAKCFRKAAEQNHAEAQSNLGVCYERGDGVAKYEVEPYKWYALAAAQGDTKAKRNASMLELMTSRQEVTEGKRKAQDWLEQHEKPSANNR